MESTVLLIPLTLLKTHVYVPVPACLTEPRVDYICVNLETLPTKLMIFSLSQFSSNVYQKCTNVSPFFRSLLLFPYRTCLYLIGGGSPTMIASHQCGSVKNTALCRWLYAFSSLRENDSSAVFENRNSRIHVRHAFPVCGRSFSYERTTLPSCARSRLLPAFALLSPKSSPLRNLRGMVYVTKTVFERTRSEEFASCHHGR